jgi:hypothetical protein
MNIILNVSVQSEVVSEPELDRPQRIALQVDRAERARAPVRVRRTVQETVEEITERTSLMTATFGWVRLAAAGASCRMSRASC